MSVAGKKSKLYASGTSTAFVGEACTQIGATQAYQINTSTKRVLDPDAPITVKDNGVAVASADLALVNPYFGIFTFATGYAVTGPVTVDASYLPLIAVANISEFSLKAMAAKLTPTVFGDNHVQKALGLKDANGDFTGFDPLTTVIDAAAAVGHQSLLDWWNSEDPKLLEFDPDGGGTYVCRTWCVLPDLDVSSQVAALVMRKVPWEGTCRALSQLDVPVSPAMWGAP